VSETEADADTLADDEELIRHISIAHVRDGRVTSFAFKSRQQKDGISMFRRSVVTVEALLKTNAGKGVALISVGQVRSVGAIVLVDQQEHSGHVLLQLTQPWTGKEIDKLAGRIAHLATVIVQPSI